MAAKIRTFIALELPDQIIRLVAALQTELKGRGLRLRWVRSQNMHLTLKFLGDTPTDHTPAIAAAVQSAAKCAAPLQLTVQGMGVFPGIRRPRVLWTGLGGQVDLLQQLHGGLEEQLEGLGIAREKRSFKAHLTLARIKAPLDTQVLIQAIEGAGGFVSEPFQIREVVLFQSELHTQGARYTALARAALGPASEQL